MPYRQELFKRLSFLLVYTGVHFLRKLIQVNTHCSSFVKRLRIAEVIRDIHIKITQFLRVIGL